MNRIAGSSSKLKKNSYVTWALLFLIFLVCGFLFVKFFSSASRSVRPTANQTELNSNRLLILLLHPKSIVYQSDNLFLVDSSEPHTTSVLDNSPVTKKELRVLGTIKQGDKYFTIISGHYTGKLLCEFNCSYLAFYFVYNLQGTQISNLEGPISLNDFPVGFTADTAIYDNMQTKDLNRDGNNEIWLYTSEFVNLGESGGSWQGFIIYTATDNRLRPLIQIHTAENGIDCARCGDMDGRKFRSEYHISQAPAGKYPDITVTRSIISQMINGTIEPATGTKTSIYKYDTAKGFYIQQL